MRLFATFVCAVALTLLTVIIVRTLLGYGSFSDLFSALAIGCFVGTLLPCVRKR